MDQEIMRKLMEITEEEQGYLQKRREVDKSIYSEAKDFVVDSRKLLRRGKLIDVRPNARFVHFPKHRHNYIEIVLLRFMMFLR